MTLKEKITIGITDCSKYRNYERWMLEAGVETILLGYTENNFKDLDRCDGVLLTGGEDVHPKFYKKPEYLPLCDKDNMDEKRDEFELKVIEYAQQHDLPVLGICRGLQIANVFFGGTLIPDIPASGKPDHSKIEEGDDRYHEVRINPYSKLKSLTGVLVGEVNSAHHQSADKIGAGLVTVAYAADGTVEALERNSENGKPFLLLVQWHPERMNNKESQLSVGLRDGFLKSVRIKVNG